ncbi:GntR family transcriptional regulator [Evansella halocellulosilytica]|uniref:GntR family transcriptional regulator n=1 Tax=Evansella halocellulosilytica TaxID=2011013 RepID=UPI000BB8E987|nr:GntR family transcriptional regulator [Evansella halocellulosilytica]
MTDQFQSSQPIYYQLANRVIRQILRGELMPGEKLLSVREMAIKTNVNPNTVQRTYRELEGMKIAESRRGQGTFVTEDEHVLHQMREEMKLREIEQFVQGMYEMGYENKEIEAGLHQFLQKREQEDKND